MDFGWSAGQLAAPGGGSDLNLLSDNFLVDLDDKTLQARAGRRRRALQRPQCGDAGPRRRSGLANLAPARLEHAALVFGAPLPPGLIGRPPALIPGPPLPQCLMGGPSAAAFATCMSGGAGEASGSAGGGGGSGSKRELVEEPVVGAPWQQWRLPAWLCL